MRILTFLLMSLFPLIIFAQTNEKCACSKKDKAKVRVYFANLETQSKKIAECEAQTKLQQKNPPVIIAGKCEWGSSGCPVHLVKPKAPAIAKRLKISGSVDVEVIIDEEGKVICAKMIEGSKLFKAAAEQAACKARFTPVLYCGKPYKQKLTIRYNFI